MITIEQTAKVPPATLPDIYPMPSFVTLVVRNVPASAAWYRDILGFQEVMAFGAPGSSTTFAHLRWTKFADLLLRMGAPASGEGMTVCYQIELDRLDSLAERARALGAKLLSEPGNRPWNTRDFTIADPDDYRISFTAGPVNRNMTMSEITARLRATAT